uniref:Crustacean hyperglycemic hormone n=1 Tax=Steinernema glaseri TaxID=37863 RepID=A0A1I7YA90_9BILA
MIVATLYLLSFIGSPQTDAYALEQQGAPADGYVRHKMSSFAWRNDKTCHIYRNEALHDMLDRVCLMCHEMFSHEQPELRVECRSNCFKNKKFQQCLSIFAPPRRTRSVFADQWGLVDPAMLS